MEAHPISTTMNVINQGGITSLTAAQAIHKLLPAATYDIQINPMTGQFELHHRPSFRMPDKIYGGHDEFSIRCLRTFRELGKGMAVLLSGPKGCGKTLTAKKLAIDSAMPVLTVSAALAGMGFNSFLTDLPNSCLIFIDEFEKVYHDKDTRNSFLSLLDGASDNKHLFILTSNESNIGEYFTNRPGRVRYHRKYQELDESVLMEMIRDKMPKGKLRAAVEKLVKELGSISPDALTCLIQECLIHSEIPAEFMSFFNIETELKGAYDVTIQTTGFRQKPRLSKINEDKARQFIRNVDEDGIGYARNYYGEGEKHCMKVSETWTARYCHPFRDTNPHNQLARKMGMEPEGQTLSANVTFAEKAGSKATRNFSFQQHQVEKMTRADGEIRVLLKDGTHYTFHKAAPFEYFEGS